MAARRQLDGLGVDDPVILAYHPVSLSNPFQRLLYSRLWQHGIAPIPLGRFEDIAALPSPERLEARVVLHLHWTNKVLQAATPAANAGARAAAFLAPIDAFLAAGGLLVWTIHNVLPHECPDPIAEGRLRQAIVDRALAVHVLSKRTAELVSGSFTIPEGKAFHVPHPSYAGAYEDIVTREAARHDLGLDPDETVYAVVGAIREYKGLDDLLVVFDRLTAEEDRPRRLLVAGTPGHGPGVEAFLAQARRHPLIHLHAERVPSEQIQVFLRAADLAVLPYRRSLNSGAMMLALTFGVPVVAPRGGAASEIVTSSSGRLFEPDDLDSLEAAIRAAEDLVGGAGARGALAVARGHDPAKLSARFAEALRGRLP